MRLVFLFFSTFPKRFAVFRVVPQAVVLQTKLAAENFSRTPEDSMADRYHAGPPCFPRHTLGALNTYTCGKLCFLINLGIATYCDVLSISDRKLCFTSQIAMRYRLFRALYIYYIYIIYII